MKEKLLNVLKNAYSPYYNFKVAAIVVTNDGNMFSGVNVENANGTSICAERNAIAAAVASGYKKVILKKYMLCWKKELEHHVLLVDKFYLNLWKWIGK